MAKNMQKHQWARSAYTLTCLVSSNLILSQAFLTNALASEAVNDLIQSSDTIKNSADGNNAASSPAPQQAESSNAASSSAPQQTGGNNVTGSTAPQQTQSNNAFSNDTSKQTSSDNVSHINTPPTSGSYAYRRVKYRQTRNSTAGSGSLKQIDENRTENAQSRVPAVKKLNFTDVAFGILAPGSPQSQGRYVHLYQFEGRENQLVQVRLVGSNDDRPTNNLSLKPYLILLDPNNQVISRRGSEGADGQLKQAFMPVRLPMKGTYTVAVTSEKPGAIGRYSLALREDRGSYALDKSGELSSRSITSQLDQSSSKIELQGKNDQSNQLSRKVALQSDESSSEPSELQGKNDQSSQLSSRPVALQPAASSSEPSELQGKNDQSSQLSSRPVALQPAASSSKTFELQGKKNQLVNIRVDSTTEQFHPYAVLMNSKAQVIAMSEATNSKYSASIDRAMLPQDDKYYVVVNSSTPQVNGKYRLTVY